MAKNYEKELKKEILYFLQLCNKEDIKLFVSEPKDKKLEDYGRFICLGLTFNFRGVFLKMFAEYESVGNMNEICEYLDTITYESAEKWIVDFLENIKIPQLKECAQDLWEEKKKYFTEHKFQLSKLLKL